MASNILSELFVKIGADVKGLKTGLDSADTRMGKFSQSIMKHHKAIGLAATAMGAAILGSLAMSLKAYAEEEKGIVRLRVAMKAVGLDYDENREALEKIIDTLQQKTAIADSDQRDSLASLMRITRDSTKALDLLELSMDVAIGTGKDLASATTLIMYALSGNWGMLERYIPAIKAAENEEEKWILLRKLFAGQAKAYGATMAGQTQLMLHNIGDIKEAIGGIVAKAIVPMLKNVSDLIVSIKAWTAEHPKLTQVIVLATGAIGTFMMALGPILIALPAIVKAFVAMRIFMITSLIPSILKTTAALWAKVQALYAAMVAMGPKGWALAATSMAIMTAGLIAITLQAKKATSSFTNTVEDYIPTVDRATSATREWGKELSKLELITRRITEAENKLAEVMAKVGEQSHGLAHIKAFLIRKGDSLINELKEEALATKEITMADEDYVDILLGLNKLTKEQIDYLRWYANETERLIKVERKHQEEIEETIKLEREKQRIYEDLSRSIDRMLKDVDYQLSAAGKLRIRTEDVVMALRLWGRTNEEIEGTLRQLGEEQDDVSKLLDILGIKAIEVKGALDGQRDSVIDLGIAYEKFAFMASNALDDIQAKTLNVAEAIAAAAAAFPEEVIAPEEGPVLLGRAATVAAGRFKVEIPTPEQIATVIEEARALGIPGYQAGGIVTRPTLAMVGERGPEAIVPLGQNMGTININFKEPVFMENEASMHKLARQIRKAMREEERYLYGGARA